jgi:hypothetical protein
MCGTNLNDLGQDKMVDICEHSIANSGSTEAN